MLSLYKFLLGLMVAILAAAELIALILGWRERRRSRRIKVVDLTAQPFGRTRRRPRTN